MAGLKEAVAAGGVVAFTGAGVSAESGIPTYRGTGGFWTQYDPDKYAAIDYFLTDPSYYWSFFRDVRRDLLHKARPNPAHTALAEMERRGLLEAVITQNIDGLHQAAGSRRVIELHGSNRRFSCLDCGREYALAEAEAALEKELPPRCGECGGVLRPGIVFFGEMLPARAVDEAHDLARRARLLLVIGSSLVVYPAAQIPLIAKTSGARLALVNDEPTPADDLADWIVRGKAGEVMPELVREKPPA
ncbi:MAG: NAD-dependent deacylase [Candidatus Zixiibacteriota bacterium]|nr:MAG: NAD-dependent deacylase [candidate division Zixibacteria bacterium]